MTAPDDAYPEALIESVRVFRNPDGSIDEQQSTIEVRVDFNMVDEIVFEPAEEFYSAEELEELKQKYDPGEFIDADYYDGASARLRYGVEDGVARLSSFKDASPSSGGWTSIEFLRVMHAAEDVVVNVPGVEQVEFGIDTMLRYVDQGEGAHIESV